MTRTLPFAAAVLLAASPAVHADPPAAPSGKVQFGRDILPILSANCFTCHGPDEKPRKAGLRLDLGETATKKLKSGARAVVPGDVKNSELIARIVSDNPDERMPPAKTQKTLKDSEKALLKRWIEEGAAYQKHWAFVAPRRPACRRSRTRHGRKIPSTASCWPGSKRKGSSRCPKRIATPWRGE